MPHNVTALYACQKMYRVDAGEGANVGRLRAFILRPVGNFRHQVGIEKVDIHHAEMGGLGSIGLMFRAR